MGIYQRKGAWNVEAYDPARKRNVYVGRCTKKADAKELLRVKTAELKAAAASGDAPERVTVDAYAERWLTIKHGPGTRRPAESTRKQNRAMLKSFRAEFGSRLMAGGVQRREALDWAISHGQQAKAVAAMWNDAIDDDIGVVVNPLANRRLQQPRGRRDINPLTEREVLLLEQIALDRWGAYGPVAAAWIRFGAWVGSRPGETFSVEPADLDFARGEVTVRRVKKRGNSYPVDVVALPDRVIEAVEAMPTRSRQLDGPLFRTVDGKPIVKGALRYYWDPVRSVFQSQVSPERWRELLAGQKNQETLDFYSLRHFCASLIVDRGGNEFDVSAQLGNSPEVARETYIHAYRDRVNDRNRSRLNGPVADLDAARRRRIA